MAISPGSAAAILLLCPVGAYIPVALAKGEHLARMKPFKSKPLIFSILSPPFGTLPSCPLSPLRGEKLLASHSRGEHSDFDQSTEVTAASAGPWWQNTNFIAGVVPTSPVRTFCSRGTLSVHRKSSEKKQTYRETYISQRPPAVSSHGQVR